MLPLETEDIEPAFAALGMNPEEYPDFLNTLPFGKKYLLERSTLTAQTEQLSPAAPHGDKPLADEQQQAFLNILLPILTPRFLQSTKP
jgi:hypothetical protein